jgi:hypothetical protein
MDLEIINELMSRVTHGFDSANSHEGLRNHQRTDVTGDTWIRQRKQPRGTKKSSTKLSSRVMQGFDSPNSPRDSEIINELLSRVTDRFDNPNGP